MKHNELSSGAQIAVGCLAVLGCVGGWLIISMGGFHHKPHRSSDYIIFVDGAGAVAMASLFFVMSALAVAALLQSLRAARWVYAFSLAVLLFPPLVYLVAQ